MKIYRRVGLMFVAAVMSIIMLAGCSGNTGSGQQAADDTAAAVLGVDEIYSRISELGILPEMLMLDDAYINGYYGIDEKDISEKVFAVAYDALKADTIIIVKAADSTKAEAMKGIFNSVNEQRLMELESYNPEQYARVEDAVIKSSGCCVYYIVSDDNDAVEQLIESNIG